MLKRKEIVALAGAVTGVLAGVGVCVWKHHRKKEQDMWEVKVHSVIPDDLVQNARRAGTWVKSVHDESNVSVTSVLEFDEYQVFTVETGSLCKYYVSVDKLGRCFIGTENGGDAVCLSGCGSTCSCCKEPDDLIVC